MSLRLVPIAALALASCGPATAPVAPADAAAISAAERKAVADTDAAFRDAAAPPAEPTAGGAG